MSFSLLRDQWNQTNSWVGKAGLVIFYPYFVLSLVVWLLCVWNVDWKDCSLDGEVKDVIDEFYLGKIVQLFSITSAALCGYVLYLGPKVSNLVAIVLIYGALAVAFLGNSDEIPPGLQDQECYQDMKSGFVSNVVGPLVVLVLMAYDTHIARKQQTQGTGEEQPLLG